MRANHGDGVAGLPLRADGEGDDGACVACEVVFAAGLKGGGPRLALLQCVTISRGVSSAAKAAETLPLFA